MGGINLIAASFFGLLLDIALLGVYTCIFGATAWLVLRRKRKFTPATLAIFVLYFLNIGSTIAVITDSYQAFVQDPLGPIDHYVNHYNHVASTFENATLGLVCVIADATLLWRLWIIWFRNYKIIVLPALIMLQGVICSVMMTVVAGHGYQNSHTELLTRLMYLTFGSSLVVNSLVTGLIVGRLYYVGYRTTKGQGSPYLRIIVALIESGALFSLSMIVYLILYSTGNNGGYTLILILPKIVGITPTLIILQINLGYVQPADSVDSDSRGPKTTILFAPRTFSTDLETLAGHGITVDMTRMGQDSGKSRGFDSASDVEHSFKTSGQLC